MKDKIIVSFLFLVSFGAVADDYISECEILGQVIFSDETRASGSKRTLSINQCRPPYIGSGAVPRAMFREDFQELLEVAEQRISSGEDSSLLDAMIRSGMGSNLEEVRSNIAAIQGPVVLQYSYDEGENPSETDMDDLKLIATSLNERRGIPERVARRREEERLREQEREARRILAEQEDNTALNIGIDQFSNFAQINSQNREILLNNCSSEEAEGASEGFETYQIHFEDGEKLILMPFEVTKISDNEIEFSTQRSGTGGLGGLRIGGEIYTRKLRLEGDRYIWISENGNEYPIEKITKMSGTRIAGFTRPFGYTGSNSCYIAGLLEDALPSGGSLQNSGGTAISQ